MAIKLFTIGDSISQGFMSGAAARTDLSYSTIISELLDEKKYIYPTWEKGGLPLNIEIVFRKLQKRLGSDIAGIFEWPIAINLINHYLDEIEDYFERGDGSLLKSIGDKLFHNVSIRGFDISNSWQITPKICKDIIEQSKTDRDGFFGMVNESLLRTAYKVLASGQKSNKEDFSQLDWLQYHHQKEGVENTFLWLGANNALGTVLDLKIRQTSNDGLTFKDGPQKISYDERRKKNWNLWHPEDFRVEYDYMLNRVIDILENNPNNTDYKVFIATIPLVTICPLIKSVGEQMDREEIEVVNWEVDPQNPAPMDISELKVGVNTTVSYGKYYPYFLFADNFELALPHLNRNEVVHIDNCIRKYNRIIQELVALANKRVGKKRFYLVDISTALSDMSLKRNNYNPKYEFPEYFTYCYPKVDTRYYGTTRVGEIKAGGIFSLDGVHPTAIGQGLIAYEFRKVMIKAGLMMKDVDWNVIFTNDTLYSQPISLLAEIYDNIKLKKWLVEKLIKN
ncbi:MAG: hypothetical protein ABI426_08345 [Flavobacterium sp.]